MPYFPIDMIPWEAIATIFNVVGNFLIIIAGSAASIYLLVSFVAIFTDRPKHIPLFFIVPIPITIFFSMFGFIARLQTPSIPEEMPVGVILQLDHDFAVLLSGTAILLFLMAVTVHSTR